jgi:hypothetical protein
MDFKILIRALDKAILSGAAPSPPIEGFGDDADWFRAKVI